MAMAHLYSHMSTVPTVATSVPSMPKTYTVAHFRRAASTCKQTRQQHAVDVSTTEGSQWTVTGTHAPVQASYVAISGWTPLPNAF